MSLIEHDKWEYHEARKPKAAMPPLTRLTDRQQALIAALAYGVESDNDAKRLGAVKGRPLTPRQAAAYLHVRPQYVFDILAQPLFKAELAQCIAAKRLAYAPKAIDAIGEEIDNIDPTIRLRAAVAMLGETAKAPAVSVTVTNQTALIAAGAIRPGYVLKLPPDDPTQTD